MSGGIQERAAFRISWIRKRRKSASSALADWAKSSSAASGVGIGLDDNDLCFSTTGGSRILPKPGCAVPGVDVAGNFPKILRNLLGQFARGSVGDSPFFSVGVVSILRARVANFRFIVGDQAEENFAGRKYDLAPVAHHRDVDLCWPSILLFGSSQASELNLLVQ